MNNIRHLFNTVIEGDYCIGCGVCCAVKDSPLKLKLDDRGQYIPILSDVSQMDKDFPEFVCPFSQSAKNEDILSTKAFPLTKDHDEFIGRYISTYAGYVIEEPFRKIGSSGGMGKWILFELLRKGMVDYVVQVGKEEANSNNVIYKFKIYNNIEEIKLGSKSVYYPVEMSEMLQYIRNHKGRYAFVGVPCFIKGLRLLAEYDPIFKERIIYHIGLVCGHLKTTRYAQMIAWQAGIKPGELSYIDFRVKIPGSKPNLKGVELIGDNRDESVVDHVRSFFGTDYNQGFFKLHGCDYCDDVVAETADIVIGDAWLPKYLNDELGNNIVIVRNPDLEKLIQENIQSGNLSLEPINKERIILSQGPAFRHRRDGLRYRLFLKDKDNVWTPPKRVAPSTSHISNKRKAIYSLREEISIKSHKAFQKALIKDDFTYFSLEMDQLLEKYKLLYRPSVLKRIIKKITKILEILQGLFI